MLNIFEAGDDSYRLADARDRDVGWVRGNAIGFDGLATEGSAIEAAVAGAEALATYLEKINGSAQPDDTAGGPLRTVHDGAYEWVVRGKRPLARLYRPDRDRSRGDQRRTFGVEFVLPSYMKPGAAIGAAQVLYRTLPLSAETTNGRAAQRPSLERSVPEGTVEAR